MYAHQKLLAITQTLDKVITNVDAIGKTIGEMKPKEVIESRDQITTLSNSIQRLDRYVYDFKQDIEAFKEVQLADNEVLEDVINKIAKAIDAGVEDPKDKIGNIELENLEEEPPAPKRRGGKSTPQPRSRTKKVVQFEDADEEEDVRVKLNKIRQQRRGA
jgi:hypothetical protein